MTAKRQKILKTSLFVFACALAGFVVGYTGADGFRLSLDWTRLESHLSLLAHLLLALDLLVCLYFFVNSRANLKRYQETTDDEVSDDLYLKLNRQLTYFSVAVGIGGALCTFLLMIGIRLTPDQFELPYLAYLGFFVLFFFQHSIYTAYKKLRNINLPFYITLKELKENVFQHDEAELQANYKLSFEIVMNLSGLILPLLYVLVAVIAHLTQQSQLLAFLVLATVHLYILLMQVKLARSFYK